MALYPITVNTPAADPAHIFAEDDAAIYEGLIGTDRVLNIGNKLNASVITNNKVRVSDGVVVVGGHVARIKKGDYQDMTIANGVSGKKRNDIIAARFMTTGSGGTDTYKLVVLQGASGTTATDPAVVKGNLYAGDLQRDYPLWRVRLDGLSIVKVEQMYEIGMSNKDLSDSLSEVNSNLSFDSTVKTYTENGWTVKYQNAGAGYLYIDISRTSTGVDNGSLYTEIRYLPFSVAFPQWIPIVNAVGNAVVGGGRAKFSGTVLQCQFEKYTAAVTNQIQGLVRII